MAGPVTITCPGCGTPFHVPAQVVRVLGHTVVVRMDRSKLYGHLAECTGTTESPMDAPLDTRPAEVSKAMAVPEQPEQPEQQTELVGRIHLMLSGGHFMARGGSGACTMCGVNRDVCLETLRTGVAVTVDGVKRGPDPCCPVCRDGNTHPAPMESRGTCAEWGAEHGAKA